MEFYGRPMIAATLLMIVCCILSFMNPISACVFFVLFLLLFIFGIISKFNYRILASLFAVILFLGSLTLTNHKSFLIQNLEGKTLRVELVAISDTEYNDDYNSVEVISLSKDKIPKFSKFQLRFNKGFDVYGGQRFIAKVRFSTLAEGKSKSNFYSRNIFINSYAERIEEFNGNNIFFSSLSELRKVVLTRISDNLSINSSAFLKGLVLGDDSSIDYKTIDAIRRCGVSHMIVVSGLHLSIVITGLNAVVNAFLFNRKIKSLISIVAVLAIMCICGFTVSVVRAAIMSITVSMAPILKRENDSINSLGFAVFLILLQSPYAIYSLSFQYSVLATLAIVWIVPFYSDIMQLVCKSKVVRKISGILTTTIIATVFTLPVTISNFGEVSIISPITNIILNYPVTYALIFTVIGAIINSGFVFKAAGLCADFSLYVIGKFGNLNAATKNMGYTPFVLLMFVTLIVPLIFSLYKYKKRKGSEEDGNND